MTMQIFKKGTAIILVLAIGLLFAGCKDETPYAPPPQQPQQPQGWAPEDGPSNQSEEPIYQQGQQETSTEWPQN